MELQANPFEQTTAATDLLLMFVALACALSLARLRPTDRWTIRVWSCAFALLAVASLLGAAAHGIRTSAAVKHILWQPLNLALGLSLPLFVVAAISDNWGITVARRFLWPLLSSGIIFFAVGWFLPESFYLFLPLASAAILFDLAVYGLLAWRDTMPGARIIVSGILITLAATAIEASRGLNLSLVWQFDHRGLYHLVQAVGLTLMTAGVRISCSRPSCNDR